MDNNSKKDENNLDNWYEDSIFSITEDAQYPLFDAEKAKEGILTKSKSGAKKKSAKSKDNVGKSSFLQRQGSNANIGGKPNIKFGDSMEGEFKIDQPGLYPKDSFGLTTPKKIPNSPFLNNNLSMNLSNLPTFGRGRPIGVMRPTPKIGGKDTNKLSLSRQGSSIKRVDSQDDLSPRSKMLPNLKEKVSIIKGGGPFTKFKRKTSTRITRNDSNPNGLKSFREELKTLNDSNKPFLSLISSKSNSNGAKNNMAPQVKQKPIRTKNISIMQPPKNEIKELKVEERKEPKRGGRGKNSKSGKGKKKSKENSNLSGRKDVVFKTLLRSIKRYYSNLFEDTTEYNELTKTKQDKLWVSIIEDFTKKIFAENINK